MARAVCKVSAYKAEPRFGSSKASSAPVNISDDYIRNVEINILTKILSTLISCNFFGVYILLPLSQDRKKKKSISVCASLSAEASHEQRPVHFAPSPILLCQNFSSLLFPEAFLEGGDHLILATRRILCSPMSELLHLKLQPITRGFLLLHFPRPFNNADLHI